MVRTSFYSADDADPEHLGVILSIFMTYTDLQDPNDNSILDMPIGYYACIQIRISLLSLLLY